MSASDGTNLSEPARVDLEVRELVDLRLAASSDRNLVGAPGSVTHTVTVQNLGPSNATGIAIDLSLVFPPGVTHDPPGSPAGTIVGHEWFLALNENESATLQISYLVSTHARGGIDVIATHAAVSALDQPSPARRSIPPRSFPASSARADIGVLELDANPVSIHRAGSSRSKSASATTIPSRWQVFGSTSVVSTTTSNHTMPTV